MKAYEPQKIESDEQLIRELATLLELVFLSGESVREAYTRRVKHALDVANGKR